MWSGQCGPPGESLFTPVAGSVASPVFQGASAGARMCTPSSILPGSGGLEGGQGEDPSSQGVQGLEEGSATDRGSSRKPSGLGIKPIFQRSFIRNRVGTWFCLTPMPTHEPHGAQSGKGSQECSKVKSSTDPLTAL